MVDLRDFPDVLRALDLEQNSTITGLTRKDYVWWKCLNESHSYFARLDHRIAGRGCNICSNRKILAGFNDLESQCPDYASELDIEKSGVKPSEVFKSSNIVLWWKCSEGHSYRASPNTRAGGARCKYCFGRKLNSGKDDLETIASKELLQEFDYSKNIFKPSELSGRSGLVWWLCSNEKHSWKADVSTRTRGSGCPFCSGFQVISGETDFATKFPEIAKEFDESRNGISPYTLAKSSNKEFWWKCPEGHSYLATVRTRVRFGANWRSCKCRSNFRSFLEKDVFDFLVESIPAEDIRVNTFSVISPYEIDLFIPNMKIAFEVNGDRWHSDEYMASKGINAQEYHQMKRNRCGDSDIALFFIWENEWRTEPVRMKKEITDFILRPPGWRFV